MKLAHLTDEMRDKFTKFGGWRNTTIVDLWERNARDYPDREAVVDSSKRFTWAQAKKWYDRVALGLLEMGFKKDEVIASQFPNLAETLLLMMALEKAGILGLPTMTTLRHSEMEYLLKAVNARGIAIVPQYRNFDYCQMIQEIRPNLPNLRYIFVVGDEVPPGTISLKEMSEKPLEVKYPWDYLERTRIGPYEARTFRTTSGTTGLPKIIEYMNQEWLVGETDAERWKLTGEDIVLALAPVIGGAAGGPCHWTPPHAAAKVVMMERFDAEEALRLIEKEQVTFAAGVPAQMAQMVNHPNFNQYDISSLRMFFYAGSSCPYNLAREVEEKMKCKVISALGSLDIGRICGASIDDPPEVRWRSVGKSYPGNEIKLVDDEGNEEPPREEGEIVWRGPTALGGYYRELQKTLDARVDGKPEGFIRTGDLGKFDEQGNLYVVGRKKDIIIRGGQNISPIEIENHLIAHPKVLNVAVVPVPDPVMVEKACACVIPKEGEEFTFDEMVSFLKEKRIAPYKLPERLEIMAKFPMSGDGMKVNKRELAKDVSGKLDPPLTYPH